MKIVVIGGSGLIGSKVVNKLREEGHEVISASPSSGVNTVTGQGLVEVLKGAEVVIDVANSPSFEESAALNFFENSCRNLFAAEKAEGIKHHLALSVVGTERLAEIGYFRAKMAQEKLIKASGIPYTIVESTQFFEFVGSIAESGVEGDIIHLPSALFQPIAAEDVASIVAEVALREPLNGTLEIAGPEKISLSGLIQRYLKANEDQRSVVGDDKARYFGAILTDQTLVPTGNNPVLGSLNFEQWFASQNKG